MVGCKCMCVGRVSTIVDLYITLSVPQLLGGCKCMCVGRVLATVDLYMMLSVPHLGDWF